MKALYYSRPTSYYGSVFDDIALKGLIDLDPFVFINPASNYADEQYRILGMDYFAGEINDLRVTDIYYLTHANGKIGAGVAKEIGAVVNIMGDDAIVREINWGTLFLHQKFLVNSSVDWKTRTIMTVDETRDQLQHDFKAIMAHQ